MSVQPPACSSCPSCDACPGCGELLLTRDELEVLRRFADLPFLPLARKADDDLPVCLGLEGEPLHIAAVLRNLESKGLISLDYRLPLSNFDYRPYASWPVQGSMALTAAGQDALEALEVQGLQL